MNINKKDVGQRIYLIRMLKGLTMEEFGKMVGGALKSNVSKWENGKSLPNTERLKLIADLGRVSVNYLLTGEQSPREELESEIWFISDNIATQNDQIQYFHDILNELNDERKKSLSTGVPGDKLLELIDIKTMNSSLQNIYDWKIKEIEEKIERLLSNKKTLQFELNELEKVLNDLNHSIYDHENPDFAEHNLSQVEISDMLRALPYLLNYESTMKIVEYAEMLKEKPENLLDTKQ